jgi:class 3 adenylate cyclase
VQQGLLTFLEKSNEFAAGLGQGIGNIFPSLSQKLQEEVLELVDKSNEFAAGLGQGLSHSLVYLDEVSQTKLTGSAKIKDYANKPMHDQGKKDTIAELARHDNDFSLLPGPYGRDIVDKIDTRLEQEPDLLKENLVDQEILFSGRRENYCICYIDMMNSTQISSTLNDLQLSKYYSIFLNSMATIAKNFGAVIIKNAGDCLIYYFPSTSNSNEQIVFKNVIECGITMISAHQPINSKLFEQRLPPLHYRISADYGKVEVARSSSSQSEDLFGSVMNVCAKINSKAPANGMVIGYKLYQIVDTITEKEYNFERIGEYSGFKEVYPIYSVKTRKKRNILNPFRKTAETISNLNLHRNTDNFMD